MKTFTVVVLYPARLQTPRCNMTYTAYVDSVDEFRARRIAEMEAFRRQNPKERGKLKDWRSLVVFRGKQKPVAYGWQP